MIHSSFNVTKIICVSTVVAFVWFSIFSLLNILINKNLRFEMELIDSCVDYLSISAFSVCLLLKWKSVNFYSPTTQGNIHFQIHIEITIFTVQKERISKNLEYHSQQGAESIVIHTIVDQADNECNPTKNTFYLHFWLYQSVHIQWVCVYFSLLRLK